MLLDHRFIFDHSHGTMGESADISVAWQQSSQSIQANVSIESGPKMTASSNLAAFASMP